MNLKITNRSGELYLKPELSMFWALSQHYQHFEKKNDMSILKQIV